VALTIRVIVGNCLVVWLGLSVITFPAEEVANWKMLLPAVVSSFPPAGCFCSKLSRVMICPAVWGFPAPTIPPVPTDVAGVARITRVAFPPTAVRVPD